ncbi:hypothetical protein ACEQ8H_005956 [Pleosporales sp. CAS-2024a]
MPPKPPIRIPIKAAPAARARATPRPPRTISTPATTPRRPSTARVVTRYGFYATMSICTGLFIRDLYFDFDKVRGASMAPTINPNVDETGHRDVVFVRPYLHNRSAGDAIRRGDVVTFWKPHRPEERGLKRVIALEGDTVYVKSGKVRDVMENGLARGQRASGMNDGLQDEEEDSVADKRQVGHVVVPFGHVWIEGDNWRRSLDSRDIGPISKSLIMGKVVGVWRGWGDFKGVQDTRRPREKEGSSIVVPGKSEIPLVYLE